ncbi:hypothetical protein EC973_003531 [Apophysomyces ossiformis]|uniref:Fumarylacetoacetase-like C-terminal domain-containing protein n=1 Tax=Apophysomyces ossiformis TaxID=679940 RepID=A0A8H7EN08_9FUNG|nr:hypothetical protein EC973_003531 [Apophysomyces ossiformis]
MKLAVVIGKNGRDFAASKAMDYVGGYALAIDMTARNLQIPFEWGLIVSESDFIAKESIPDTSNVDLWLKVNGAFRQQGNTKDMIFSIPSLLEYVGSIMKLEIGDVILTGTPQGVGPIHAGDVITAGLKPGHATSDLVQVKYSVSDRNGLFKC